VSPGKQVQVLVIADAIETPGGQAVNGETVRVPEADAKRLVKEGKVARA
jgi:hypothetical protein